MTYCTQKTKSENLEIKRRFALTWGAFTKLRHILGNRDIPLNLNSL